MDIKKSDSKGRVSGFDRDANYHVTRTDEGIVILAPLSADFPLYVPWIGPGEKALEYLKAFGIDPNEILMEGVSYSGYYARTAVRGERERRSWPEGFYPTKFAELLGAG